ncbi:predicted protein [Chaetomium globosum CBS 148.51]|uniref:Uncharacterized protein n=1 Tax=Chaetomium globosum (strain ATCC 6205 / CBS 148.51 / DSM 1962 / NBRC 6347 / NRRL 1970) TaxID=306901 RepID=Q2H1L8_CHAGB|nr:uncharacterized protein CHGG_04328 [Chaetomium globosum CBS 148.51]EAQ87709.1 predicted protein [Chaetomium globosum CBS 148.51]
MIRGFVYSGSSAIPPAPARRKLLPMMVCNLLKFYFTRAAQPEPGAILRLGCRDWISQVFIRLHATGLIAWEVSGIGGHEQPTRKIDERTSQHMLPTQSCIPIDWLAARGVGFHNIIGKAYDYDRAFDIVWYRPMNLRYGLYDGGFIRFAGSQGLTLAGVTHTLPYC